MRCLSFPLLRYSIVNWQKCVPRLIWQGKRWLFCYTHEPSIANSEPWLNIFPCSSWVYEQTRIRKYVMAIVLHGLRSFDEIRWWLVDGLECGAPGRNRIKSIRTVQRRKFVATTSSCSLGLRVLKIMCEEIYCTRMSKRTGCSSSWCLQMFSFAMTSGLNGWSGLTRRSRYNWRCWAFEGSEKMCWAKVGLTNPLNPQMGLWIPTTCMSKCRMHWVFLDRSQSHKKLQGREDSVP